MKSKKNRRRKFYKRKIKLNLKTVKLLTEIFKIRFTLNSNEGFV